ncbi:RNA polymerase sigma factor [Singulisphaera sp. PoT]|uniref:RNA polymerase sigma factor n=1 Tax=Singulisphaera sp. PoT TaxID=3411797 RepID=UPI003BF56F65
MDQDRRNIELEILVLRCQRGEREAFEELVLAWERRLFFYIRRLVADEAEAWQVLQEVWLQVLRGIRTLRDPGRLPVWLYAVTRNIAMSHHRADYSRERSLDVLEVIEPCEDDDQAAIEDAEAIHHGLAKIPTADREVLTLFFLRDLSIAEVAEVLGIPPGTVKSRLFKAKKSLRQALDHEGLNDA